MEDNMRGFILKQIQEQEKVINKFQTAPNTEEYKAALKAITTLTAELRKDEEFELKRKEKEFEMETKRRAEEHRIDIETIDSDIRLREANSRIEIASKEFDLKKKDSEDKIKQQGLLTVLDFVRKVAVLRFAYNLEATGFLIPTDKLSLDKKL
jgi:hypothetical protein